MQSPGLGRGPLPLFQEVGDVFATEGVVSPGVLQGALDFLAAVEFAQGDDLLDLVPRVAALFLQTAVIVRRVGREGQEPAQQLLGSGLAALGQEFLDVLGLLQVLMPRVAARVLGHQLVLMIKAEAIGTGLEDEGGIVA